MEVLTAAIVSVIVEMIKRYVGTSTAWTILTLVAVSFLAAAVVYALKWFGLWEAFFSIVLMAAGIYGLFIKQLSK